MYWPLRRITRQPVQERANLSRVDHYMKIGALQKWNTKEARS